MIQCSLLFFVVVALKIEDDLAELAVAKHRDFDAVLCRYILHQRSVDGFDICEGVDRLVVDLRDDVVFVDAR